MMQDLIPKLANRHLLVVGDVVLDEYLIGKVNRMSREAPVPVLEFESRLLIPGGAANPAVNIAKLGSTAHQVAVVGDDDAAAQLRAVLDENHIHTAGLITDSSRPTTLKTRLLAQMGLRFPQQIARIDRLSREPISADVEDALLACVGDKLANVDAVLFSDYHAGLLTPRLVEGIRAQVADLPHKVILTADAQGELDKYAGMTLIKCNADDARAYLQRDLRDDEDFAQAAQDLFDALKVDGGMVITRGADGATLATRNGAVQCPAPSILDVYDTVGAGDTSIAVMTLALVAGASYYEAVLLANYASGLVVRRVGNYAPSPDELARAVAMWES